MFSAVYLPALPPQTKDPSKSGFANHEDAQAYIDTKVCDDCRTEHLKEDGIDACYYEWIVVPTEKAAAAETLDQLLDAAGWVTVYQRSDK